MTERWLAQSLRKEERQSPAAFLLPAGSSFMFQWNFNTDILQKLHDKVLVLTKAALS